MSVDPDDVGDPAIAKLLKKPRRELLDHLLKAKIRRIRTGVTSPTDVVADAVTMTLLVESSFNIEGLTARLIRLTKWLIALTVMPMETDNHISPTRRWNSGQ